MKDHIVAAISTVFALFILLAFAIMISNPMVLPIQVSGIVIGCSNLLWHLGWIVRHWLDARAADQVLPTELQ